MIVRGPSVRTAELEPLSKLKSRHDQRHEPSGCWVLKKYADMRANLRCAKDEQWSLHELVEHSGT